ncbi:TPA: hypothetical protein ACIRLG_002118 [Streptococcus suis]
MSLKELIQIGFLVRRELYINWLTVVFSRRKTSLGKENENQMVIAKRRETSLSQRFTGKS